MILEQYKIQHGIYIRNIEPEVHKTLAPNGETRTLTINT